MKGETDRYIRREREREKKREKEILTNLVVHSDIFGM